MGNSHQHIVEAAVRLAAQVPRQTVDVVAKTLEEPGVFGLPSVRTRITQNVPQSHYRGLVTGFLDQWRAKASDVPPESVAIALRAAAYAEDMRRKSQSVECVWTGPEAEAVPFRQTEQAILQVLDCAQQKVTLVSYAVYKIPHISEALVRAAGRGAQIRVVVETPHKMDGQNEYSTLRALGEQVASCAAVYFWPEEKRAKDNTGKHGILHVKCAVADGRWLFLSSANLTKYAFTLNMELGVLMIGGPLPAHVEEHFDRLIRTRVLVKV